MATCVKCGVKQSLMDVLTGDLTASDFLCQNCYKAKQLQKEQDRKDEQKRIDAILQAAQKVVVTTPKIDGYYAVSYLGIESVEYVIGTGIFSEVTTDIADFFGARSTAFEIKLQTAKKQAMDTLKFRAAERGANAVIGVDLDYAEFSGNRVALIINGTLVKLAPIQTHPPTVEGGGEGSA
jgi:uncharacterized protein YbjQ (UPF0145 family)